MPLITVIINMNKSLFLKMTTFDAFNLFNSSMVWSNATLFEDMHWDIQAAFIFLSDHKDQIVNMHHILMGGIMIESYCCSCHYLICQLTEGCLE